MKTNPIGAAYVPSPRSDFIGLSRTPAGKLYRKRILKFGEFPHPADPKTKLTIDGALAGKLVENFHNKVCDIVQIPLANDENKHVEDVTRNVGEVIDIDVQDGSDPVLAPDGPGVYANMDIRKDEAAREIGRTLLGTSAMIHMDYTDTRTGEKAGPTLLHTLITNRPYLTDLGDYREVVAASADTPGVDDIVVFGAQKEESHMTYEELIEALKTEHDTDVVAMTARIEELEEQVAREPDTDKIVDALAGVLAKTGVTKLSQTSENEVTIDEVAEGIVELSQEFVSRDQRIASLEAERAEERKQAATREVESLVKEGRVIPAAKDTMIELAQNDRTKFESLVSPQPLVALAEQGVTVYDTRSEDIEAEVERLAKAMKGESE
jgi:hypothetical protein